MKLKSETYDILVVVAEVWISALAAFIIFVGEALNIACAATIAGIVSAFGVMLGTILKGSRDVFWGKTIVEDENEYEIIEDEIEDCTDCQIEYGNENLEN